MNLTLRRNTALIASALSGLSKPQKTLQAKWFYDQAGSALFERITTLPEYYPTRTELRILKSNVASLAASVAPGTTLVELGSGASTKTRTLLDGMPAIDRYVPLDISAGFLSETARGLAQEYPSIRITPLAADFMAPLHFPADVAAQPKLGFFPGSTLGNLDADDGIALLARVRRWPNVAGFLLGVDLIKPVARLIAAYDDASGVTAAFNKNILHRLNREAAATLNPDAFRHEARWNAGESHIEMHLVARTAQHFSVDGKSFSMAAGESIHTENSHKYTRDRIERMAHTAGWSLARFLTDDNQDFAVVLLTPQR